MAAASKHMETRSIALPAAAAVERYFQVSLFLLVTTGFLTLAGTGRLDLFSIIGVSAALAVRALLLARNRTVVIPERWTSLATLAYLLFFVTDFLFLSGSYVTASVHLVLFSIAVKLFSVQRERDHLYLIILSFLAVLSAAVLTVDTLFLASFCVFSLIGVNTFLSMEMRRSLRSTARSTARSSTTGSGEHSEAGHSASGHSTNASSAIPCAPLSLALSGTGLLLTAGTLVISLGLFFLLPRLSAGYLSSYSPRNEFVSGFSESVELGEIGRIQQSNVVVMHVELENSGGARQGPEASIPDLKWRGVALTHFDGKLWSNPPEQAMEIASGNGGRFDLWRRQGHGETAFDPSGGQSFRPLRYRVVMEPVGTNVLFLAPVAASLQARIRDLGIDSNGSIFNLDHGRMTESYEATSLVPQLAPKLLRSHSGEYPPEIAAAYTQLPEHLDPRISELARHITENVSTDYDKAMAVQEYLRANYGYSLQMAVTPPADPLAYFLFERKQGHCEYFASAMAVLLRTQGIPSRIVNGFRAGEYNDLTGKYIIRGRDAHSWVEAYLPAYGWFSFDPTPPDAQASNDTWSRMLLYLDAGREFWREWVINYDFLHQRTLTVSAGRKGLQIAEEARLWGRHQYHSLLQRARSVQQSAANSPLRWGMLAAIAGGILLLLANLRGLIRGWRRSRLARNPARAPQAAASIWYERMIRSTERRGMRKLPGQTPAEFVEAISEPVLRSTVAAFTENYEQARFGNSPEHARRLPQLYEEVVGAKK
jgi:hypothetical protein